MLQETGASLRTMMGLMRHTDPKLTMNTYADLELIDLAGAVDRLPDLDATPQPEGIEQERTGTDDVPVEKVLTKSMVPRVLSSPVQSGNDVRHIRGERKNAQSGNGATACQSNDLHEKSDPEETESPSLQMVGATGFEPATS